MEARVQPVGRRASRGRHSVRVDASIFHDACFGARAGVVHSGAPAFVKGSDWARVALVAAPLILFLILLLLDVWMRG